MKRSEINQLLIEAKTFMAKRQFVLPPWAYWYLADWKKNKRENIHEVIENMLGWDITDFGSGNFHSRGLFLFTLRNGNLNAGEKTYAEKIMIVGENQETPLHFHRSKMEDIINRGGGNLVVELYNSTENGKLDSNPVQFKIDGIARETKAGSKILLGPGESICLKQRMYHKFYGELGKGKVLVGEVSMVNDDNSDNYFYETVGRFPLIEEDESPMHLLVSDYGKYL